MRRALRGIRREKTRKTTIGDGAETVRPEDLVNRKFLASAPNQKLFTAFDEHVLGM